MVIPTTTLLNTAIYKQTNSAKCVTYTTDYYQRITLESWFPNYLEQTPLTVAINYLRL